MSAETDERGQPLRRRDAMHQHTMRFGPNMTPMVDIVMVILIFFMASTTFISDEWLLRSGLARGAERQQEARRGDPFALPPVLVTIELRTAGDGSTVATGAGVADAPLQALQGALRKITGDGGASDELAVSISSAAQVPYADVVRVHAMCEDVGLSSRIGLE